MVIKSFYKATKIVSNFTAHKKRIPLRILYIILYAYAPWFTRLFRDPVLKGTASILSMEMALKSYRAENMENIRLSAGISKDRGIWSKPLNGISVKLGNWGR